MITPTEASPDQALRAPTFNLVLSEPAQTVSVHLVSAGPVPPKALAVCIVDPAGPGGPLVERRNGWTFSQKLESSFVYAPATERPTVISLPVAHLLHPAGSLTVTVHPWAPGSDEAAAAIEEVWFGVTSSNSSLDVSKVVRS
ncbi:hypothetical protein ACXR8F_17790 [Terrabacter sp. AAH1]